jgi:glycosyltransferase involved in cell wall biosynthesis
MKVAIVCDWLVGIGGAERVVLELHKIYPDAPIYTSQYDPQKLPWFKDADVRTTWLQKLPKRLRKFLPVLRAWTFSRLDLGDYDLVISSSGAEAKGIKTGPNTMHVSYCHSPTHYYWIRYDEYMQYPGFGVFDPLARVGLRLLVGPMKRWDKKAAQRPDFMIANSNFTQTNIKKYYGRDSTVIHPPVDIQRFKPKTKTTRSGFVTAGNQRPYMRRDLAVAACTKLNLPLTVIGNGPEHNKLIGMAGPSVRFLTDVSDQEMPIHFQAAGAFIFPGMEDFGIVAVEAMASGTPVIAYKAGGALDYVIPGKTGEFFTKQTVDSLAEALQKFKPEDYAPDDIKRRSQAFSNAAFQQNLKHYLHNILK